MKKTNGDPIPKIPSAEQPSVWGTLQVMFHFCFMVSRGMFVSPETRKCSSTTNQTTTRTYGVDHFGPLHGMTTLGKPKR